MKHCKLLLLIMVVALFSTTAMLAADGLSIFKFPNINPKGFTQFTPFQMVQGWENGNLVWFIATDASDQQIACKEEALDTIWGINFAPALANLAGQVAMVYIIANAPASQGPVFTAVPGDPTYSGIWQVVYVTYKANAAKHAVKNANPYDPVLNPTGLPSDADATFTYVNRAGEPIVVKYPIVAVGPLDGPWFPAAPGSYRIAQGKVMNDYTRTKTIWLPFWEVYCKDSITKRVDKRLFVVPDVFDPAGLPIADQLAPKLNANVAPGLGLINQVFTQPFYWQLGAQPLSQLPILHACPESFYSPCQNFNYDYTPVETVVVLQRNVPPLAASSIINNETTLLFFESQGFLTQIRASQVINATVLPGLS